MSSQKEDESKEKEEDWVEVEFEMWESCKIEKKEFFPEREAEQECNKEEVDSKMEGGENFDQINGISSTENINDGGSPPSKQQQHQKKKPMLGKFGSLLKKKGTSCHKYRNRPVWLNFCPTSRQVYLVLLHLNVFTSLFMLPESQIG